MTCNYQDECIRQIFRHRLAKSTGAVKKLMEHYSGLKTFLDEEQHFEVELTEKLKQKETPLSQHEFRVLIDELYIAAVNACSDRLDAIWDQYECTFQEFLDTHKYVRVWSQEENTHNPSTLLVMYGGFKSLL